MSGIGSTGLAVLQQQAAYRVMNQAAQKAYQQPYDYAAVAQYLPAEDTRIFLRELAIRHISETDAKAIIRIIAEYISKDERKERLETDLETSILQWLIEKQS